MKVLQSFFHHYVYAFNNIRLLLSVYFILFQTGRDLLIYIKQ